MSRQVVRHLEGSGYRLECEPTEEVEMGLRDSRVETAIAVSDLDRARRFYSDQLGLGAGEAEEGGVRYTCGDGTRIFVYASGHAGQSSATVAGWLVHDLDQLMAELGSRGVVFEQYDQPGIKTDEHGVFDRGGFRAAWFRDPDGNTMALTQTR
jgi:catechol 2,3-dioxygenase-like lactoylglutathione lyase family enzyme